MSLSFPQDFPISKKWPPQHPERLQLYSLLTPNGQKVSVALEEMGIPYESHTINIMADEQFAPEFLQICPNNKIPAIIDPHGPNGQALALFESGAILIYLAEKTGQFLPQDAAGRYTCLQWLMWQMGGVGPMFGQVGFFHKYAGKDWEDKRPLARYANEGRRLLGVLDKELAQREWLAGDYSIADMAVLPWVRNLVAHYGAGDLVGMADFKQVQRALSAFEARPAVARVLAEAGR